MAVEYSEKAQEVLELRQRAFRLLYDFIFETETAQDEKLPQIICKYLLQLTEAKYCAAAYYDSSKREIELKAIVTRKKQEAITGKKLQVTEEIETDIMKNQVEKCVEHHNCLVEFFNESLCASQRYHNCYRLSSHVRDELIAIFSIGYKKDEKLQTIDMVDAFLSLAGMIIQRVQHQDVIREAEERFKDLVFSSADFVWEIDTEGKYTLALGNVEKILGYKPAELIGKTPFELMPEAEKNRIYDIFTEIVKTRSKIENLENWALTKDGQKRCLITNGVPIFDKGKNFVGYRGVDKDITESKKAQEKIEKKVKELNKINSVMVDRELKMIELKKEIKKLKAEKNATAS